MLLSNYVRTADFAAKDGLATGTALKALKGTELGLEFDNIATMSATKVDSASNASLLSLVLTGSAVPANGIYLPAANTVGLASNTTQRATVNSTGNWNFNVATSGVTATINANSGNEGLAVQGSTAGTASFAYVTFKDSTGARLGYIGNPGISGGHTVVESDNGNIRLLAAAGFGPQGSIDAGVSFIDLGWRDMPQTVIAAPYTLVLADRGKHIFNSTVGANITIPANASVALPVGTVVTIVNNAASAITIGITTDTLVFGGIAGGSTGTRTLADHGVATLIKVTTTAWYITGVGLT